MFQQESEPEEGREKWHVFEKGAVEVSWFTTEQLGARLVPLVTAPVAWSWRDPRQVVTLLLFLYSFEFDQTS